MNFSFTEIKLSLSALGPCPGPGFYLATEFAAVDVADPVQLSQSTHRPSSSVSRARVSL